MASLQSCGVSRPVNTNQVTASLVAGLTLLAGMLVAETSAAQQSPRAAVRKPIPTEQLLDQRSSLSLSERIRQVTAILPGNTIQDSGTSDSVASDSVELAEGESTDLLATDAANETNRDRASERAASESDRVLRSRTTNKHLAELLKPIRQIDLRSGSEGRPVPENRAAAVTGTDAPFFVTGMGYPVPPPDRYTICQTHRPLYFEQPNLERCGNGFGVFQNAVSGATFLANTIMLPYKAGKHRADCEVLAGGDCKSCQTYPANVDLIPLDRRGVTLELAAIAGFTFLLL